MQKIKICKKSKYALNIIKFYKFRGVKVINSKILGMLGLATRAGKTVFGAEATQEAIQKRKVKLIIVAQDAADRTKRNFEELCNKNEIPIRIILTINEISNSIGQINKAIVGIRDINFSKEILRIIDGGEIIG